MKTMHQERRKKSRKTECRKRLCTVLFAGCAVFLTACGGDAKEQYENGLACFENKNYKQAASYLEKAVAEDSEKAEYYIAYGMALSMYGETENALLQFDKAILDKDNSIVRENNKYAYRGKGICYYNAGNYKEAAENFDKALEIKTKEEALDRDIMYYQIDTCLRLGEYEKVKETCDSMLSEKPDALLFAKRAQAEKELGDLEGASIDYDKAIEADAGNSSLYLGKYQMLMEAGEESLAKEVLTKAKGLEVTTDEDKYHMAKIKYFSGDFEAAAADFQEVAEKGYPFSYFYLGQMSEAKEDYVSAVENYDKYIQNPAQGSLGIVYERMGSCYVKMDDMEKALEAYQKGIEKADADSKKALLFGVTALYEQQGDFETAKKYAEEYVGLYPEDEDMKRELDFLETRL